MDNACPAQSLTRFLAPGITLSKPYLLSAEESHHLKDVLRLKAGDKIILLDLAGQEFMGEILKITKKGTLVKALTLLRREDPLFPQVIFLVPLLKKDWLSFLVEKAVELSVTEIVPVITERTVAKPKENLVKKLEKRALQSLKQCRRLWPLKINTPQSLAQVAEMDADLKIFAYEKEREKNPKEILKASSAFKKILVLTGPEGGFSEKEAAFLCEKGFIPTCLGQYILRAETAALYLMSIIHFMFFLQKS
ncbi:RsmE family RNA methyltransferase [Thermodesulfatator atlanticus]|uniref:RsmE family RNA methyltransferase n=1 Tax=Thermodesulfatator atlanticus TaxID=501497 RepID=UPI0003B379A2|nr:16S rRNA (uracil(1498)-N(3))-methyltransferase [Thermodesulfatator atlanticus]